MSRFSSCCSYICVTFLALLCIGVQVETTNDTSDRFLPAYAIASRAHLLNSTRCKEELRDFRNAVDHRILWALQMLDSSGESKPGFLYGNNFWLGSRSQCHDTMNTDPLSLAERENDTLYRQPREKFPPFRVNYFVAYFTNNSTLQYHPSLFNEDLITLGLCLPASCSTKELGVILEKIFRDRVLLVGHVYSADFKLVEVKNLKDDHEWLFSGAVLFIGSVLAFTWILMIVGTIYDIFVYQKNLKAKKCDTHYEEATSLQKMPNCDTNDSKNVPGDTELTSLPLRKESKLAQVLMCFSIYTNTKIIFDTKVSSIPTIHGLKFLTMIWVLMGHTVLYSLDNLDNILWLVRLSDNFALQTFSNAMILVDTFFFLSGFLLTYTYLTKATDKMQPISFAAKLNEFFVITTKRFIRITPAYMMTIGIVYLNSSWYSRTSQFYMNEKSHEICAKYWWRNLLYINNFFDSSSMCLSWSWYLTNDMQFFIIGLILLILSSMYFYTAVVILCTLLMGTIVLTGYISYIYGYIPTLDEQLRLRSVFYNPPWIRISPYIIGMITAYIMIKVNKKMVLRKRTLILCWCFGIACNLTVLFGLYQRRMSVIAATFYVALSKPVWAISLAWILLACDTKHGGIIDKLLSSRYWIPLSRLTYCAYLINPFVINSIVLHGQSTTHLDHLHLIILMFGIIMVTYLCAYVLSLMSETPYMLLLRNFSQSHGIKQRTRR